MAVRPLSSYPKEFVDVWAAALAGTLALTFPTRGTATNFKQRMYSYRKRLAEEAPLMAEPLLQLDICQPKQLADGQWELRVEIPAWKLQVRALAPQLSNEEKAAQAAARRAAAQELPALPQEPPGAMDSTLKDLGFGIDLD